MAKIGLIAQFFLTKYRGENRNDYDMCYCVRCPIVGNDVVAGESARPICAIYKPTISVATIVVIG